MTDARPIEVVTADDVEALAIGVALLGSGSAGNPRSFTAALGTRLRRRDLAIYPPEAFPEATVVPAGIVGSTSVIAEKLPSGREFRSAVAALSRWTRTAPSTLMALEAGGLNGIHALLAALDVELPFIDADLMGRAMPRLTQFTWAARHVPLTPAALCDPNGQVVVIDDTDAAGLERTVRALVPAAGGWAALALHPVDLREASEQAIVGSMSRALRLGRAHASLPENPSPMLVEDRLGGVVIAVGRVVEVERHSAEHSFGRGSAVILDRSTHAVVRLEMENELLLALSDGTPVASCPDILCLLDQRTASPISVDNVRIGHEVMLLVLPAPGWWLQSDVLPVVSPASFGLACSPELLEATQ